MTLQDKRSMMLSLVEQWRQSGLSQAEFARIENIRTVKLRYWISKHSKSEYANPGFIQLNGLPSSGISIRYPNGVELILPAQVPAGYLKMLISI
ncbi:MAG: hypothetical protein WCO44_17730 [Bacteroidota bacterium]